MHSHILPGLDDGSVSLEQSLRMLQIAYDEGIDIIIATPHNMPGKGVPSEEQIRQKVKQLRDLVERYDIPIQIYYGTEYYYREEVQKIFDEERAIAMGYSDCVLVEFNPMEEKVYIRNAIRNICSTGYSPIIAHVERYDQLMRDFEMLRDLRKIGAMLQVNASSVIGENGRKTKSYVKKMLKEQLVDVIGTDAHSDGRRSPRYSKCAEYLYKKYPEAYVDRLVYTNAIRWLGMKI